ncbi:hypothetical protein BpHYR1_001286 [Brachionus plicatilis]|uniref:Uncharacterized protein n=1 Tax=Brachionus plicatilis TaxID=10195 RepID=A0A3M7SXR7_BRAPC|nr:hypothetical protein BpHYR1_001286 [Brachionus plicatilis]
MNEVLPTSAKIDSLTSFWPELELDIALVTRYVHFDVGNTDTQRIFFFKNCRVSIVVVKPWVYGVSDGQAVVEF